MQTASVVGLSDGWSIPECPICKQERKEQQAREHAERAARMEEERKKRAIENRLGRADIPPRFAEKRFDAFRPKTAEEERALLACREYARDFRERLSIGQCMILCGVPGTGKTHLACAVLNEVAVNASANALYLSFAKAIRSVKQTYSRESSITEQEAIDALVKPDLLVLDEVGVQFGSDAEKMIGFEIINSRYEAMKPTIIVSNLSGKQLIECLGDRVVDRLRENGGKMLMFTGESRRGAA
ncbi:MAG: ATP-binding protein [Acetobacteraceae bacterium]